MLSVASFLLAAGVIFRVLLVEGLSRSLQALQDAVQILLPGVGGEAQ